MLAGTGLWWRATRYTSEEAFLEAVGANLRILMK